MKKELELMVGVATPLETTDPVLMRAAVTSFGWVYSP